MAQYPASIKNLIDQFSRLPGIGPKTAERLVFYLLRQPHEQLSLFGISLEKIKDKIKTCSKCQNFAESNPCDICSNSKRSSQVICIVAKPQDVYSLEKIGEYEGVYRESGRGHKYLSGRLTEKRQTGRAAPIDHFFRPSKR